MKKYILIILALSLSLFGCSSIEKVVEREDLEKKVQDREDKESSIETQNDVEEKEISEDIEEFEDMSEESEEKEDIVQTYDRQARIDAYQELNPSMSYEECVKRVYMNLDCDPYTNVTEIEDVNSVTMLVNKYNGLPSLYSPTDLVEVLGGGQVRMVAAEAFNALIEGCSEFGLSVSAWSAFRNYDYQNYLYTNGVINYGWDYAEQYWTHAGHSEHQTGLTIDVCLDWNYSDLNAARYNVHYSQFLEVLHEYGFILRYADDKQEYTLIAPESWHIRYVGVNLATYLYENNLSLDEYYGMVDAGFIQPVES